MTESPIQIAIPSTGDEELNAVKEPIESGWLTQGPKVREFEKKFAKHHSVPYAIATTSCTTALHLILYAMGVGPGDEVIVPSFTWVATANVVKYCGATPILVDIEPYTFNIDPHRIIEKLSDKTKAVIAVHLFGLCVDIPALKSKLPSHIKVIEDAACATGASLNGLPAGSLGDAAAFSFHPRKVITTGEGGMITTKNAELAEHMVKLRNHGAEVSEEQRHRGPQPFLMPDFNIVGFNYRMTDLQGAIGIEQLAKLNGFIQQRKDAAAFYHDQLSAIEWLELPYVPEGHSLQSYVVKVHSEKAPMPRNSIMARLQAQGISTRPGTHAVHTLAAYATEQGSRADFPNALYCAEQSMAIPLHNKMSHTDYLRVVNALREIS